MRLAYLGGVGHLFIGLLNLFSFPQPIEQENHTHPIPAQEQVLAPKTRRQARHPLLLVPLLPLLPLPSLSTKSIQIQPPHKRHLHRMRGGRVQGCAAVAVRCAPAAAVVVMMVHPRAGAALGRVEVHPFGRVCFAGGCWRGGMER